MGKYIDFYCGNNNRELKKIVDSILNHHFRWIAQKDYDDFYSIAAQVVWECERRFDEKSESFHNFLSVCIHNRIKSQLTYMNRDKRVFKDEEGNPLYELSIDRPIDEESDITIGDKIADNFDIEQVVFEKLNEGYSKRMRSYLDRLSGLQRKVLYLVTSGYFPNEIQECLHISKKQYVDCNAAIHSYRNTSMLF